MASKSIFPDEIMTEILLKLPFKSILRCNVLSKHYYSLIHSKYFIRRHLAHGRLKDRLYDQSIVGPIRGSVRLFDRRCYFEVLETLPPVVEETSDVHGLVVCGPVEGLYWVIDPKNERFAVWNPSTREQLLLPRIPLSTDFSEEYLREFRAARLRYGLNVCPRQCYAYGFGYDDTTDDYKFVLIYGFLSDRYGDPGNVVTLNARSFNIFSVSKGEWSTKEWTGIVPWELGSGVGVFVHGACHWVYKPSDGSVYTVLAVDMKTELHRMIAFPIVGDNYVWSDVFIVTFNGCIGLVNAHRGDNMKGLVYSSFDVWVMAEYEVTESWTILYQVSLPDGICGHYLGIVRDRFYFGEGDDGVVSYDLYSKDEERYGVLYWELGILVPYEESLVRIIKSV